MMDLAGLPGWAYAFALVLCRCGAAVMLLPGLGEAEPPAALRAGLSLAFVAVVLPGVGALAPPEGWAAAAAVVAELVCGGVLGWLARCITLALPVAGQVVSFMLGLSSVIVPDPELGAASATSKLFALAAPVLVLSSGLWMLPVAALAGSYSLVPPGHLLPPADTAAAGLAAVADGFALALRLSAPFVLASVVWQVTLGVLSRLIPQLQVYFAALPGQIFGGLALLAVLAAGMMDAWLGVARDGFAALPGL